MEKRGTRSNLQKRSCFIRISPAEAIIDWRAVCGRTARTVRREGRLRGLSYPYQEEDIEHFEVKIQKLNLELIPSRPRAPQEGKSLYFYDYDNHLFELHTGNLTTRLSCYNEKICLNPESN